VLGPLYAVEEVGILPRDVWLPVLFLHARNIKSSMQVATVMYAAKHGDLPCKSISLRICIFPAFLSTVCKSTSETQSYARKHKHTTRRVIFFLATPPRRLHPPFGNICSAGLEGGGGLWRQPDWRWWRVDGQRARRRGTTVSDGRSWRQGREMLELWLLRFMLSW